MNSLEQNGGSRVKSRNVIQYASDKINELAGKDTKSLAEFRYELYKHSPNDSVEVTYIRDGKEQKTKLTLGKSE